MLREPFHVEAASVDAVDKHDWGFRRIGRNGGRIEVGKGVGEQSDEIHRISADGNGVPHFGTGKNHTASDRVASHFLSGWPAKGGPWTAAACCRFGGGQPAARGAERIAARLVRPTPQAAPSAKR